MSERSNSCPVETLRAHLRQQAERIGELERTLDNPWSQGASFPGYTVCDQCGCFHHITRPHDCKPEVQPPERCATLPGVIRRHYRPMPGLDEPSGPVVIVHFGTIWAWGSDEATAYMRFEEKLMKAQAAAEQRGRLKGLEQAIEWSSRGTLDGNARAELARLRVEAKE